MSNLDEDFDSMLHCSDTWKARAREGELIDNMPRNTETVNAIRQLCINIIAPVLDQFGSVQLTYGFASAALTKAVRERARRDGVRARISPDRDQHAGYEQTDEGKRICPRGGMTVDLRVPGHTAKDVMDWVKAAGLPFDRIYFYGEDRALHFSWSPDPLGRVTYQNRR